MTKKLFILGGIVCLALVLSACTKTTITDTLNTAVTNVADTNQKTAADPNQYMWSTMNQGPYRDKVTFATSTNLTNWTASGTILAEHASVPGAVIKDGTIYVYFVDVTTDGVAEKLGMVSSADNGQHWTTRQFITIDGLGDKATADPDPVLLADGRIRLYYFDINESRLVKPASGIPPTNKIYSAISTDGVHFTQEAGVRFERSGTKGIFDPDVNLFGTTWYLYGGDSQGQSVVYATSADGLTFTEQGIVYTGGGVPDVFLHDNTYYLFTAGIGITTSATPTSFTRSNTQFVDPSYRITADPSVVQLTDGSYLMLYKVSGQ